LNGPCSEKNNELVLCDNKHNNKHTQVKQQQFHLQGQSMATVRSAVFKRVINETLQQL